MKILIIGPNSVENKMLVETAKKRGHYVCRVSIKQLVFALKENTFTIFYKNNDIASYDICLIRGVNPFFARAKTVAKYLSRKNVPVVDKELYNKVYTFDKMFMYSALQHHGLPCPDTFYFPTMIAYKKNKFKWQYPILVKDVHGMHGRNIYFRYSKEELDNLFNRRKINKFFIQQCIDADCYYRVLVVGKKVLGAMKRYTLKYLRKKRVPLAKRSMAGQITKAQAKLALKAAKATNSDIAGVDMIYDEKGNAYILEVNRSPNFKRFTQIMQVNVAEQIIKYLEKNKNANFKIFKNNY